MPKPTFQDKRRKHEHFMAVITYLDGRFFGRAYTSQKKAEQFAKRQQKSPAVKTTRVKKIG